MNTDIEIHGVYIIELCSGERTLWEFLGPDPRGEPCWRDLATKHVFRESSLMYAWRIVGRANV